MAADGRIEPGDMLLQVLQPVSFHVAFRPAACTGDVVVTSHLSSVFQVNSVNFEDMSNDDAVRVLREIVHKPG